MTRREWMQEYHPDCVRRKYDGGVRGCPFTYPDLPDTKTVEDIVKECEENTCAECWNTEMTQPKPLIESLAVAGKAAEKAFAAMETVRRKILQVAIDCVCKDRNEQYGDPEDSFDTIAGLWSAYFGREYTAHDVAMALALLKVGRIAKGQRKADNYIDLAGYAACAAEIAEKERKNEQS